MRREHAYRSDLYASLRKGDPGVANFELRDRELSGAPSRNEREARGRQFTSSGLQLKAAILAASQFVVDAGIDLSATNEDRRPGGEPLRQRRQSDIASVDPSGNPERRDGLPPCHP